MGEHRIYTYIFFKHMYKYTILNIWERKRVNKKKIGMKLTRITSIIYTELTYWPSYVPALYSYAHISEHVTIIQRFPAILRNVGRLKEIIYVFVYESLIMPQSVIESLIQSCISICIDLSQYLITIGEYS